MDVMDIHRTYHLMAAEYAFFSSAHGICPKRGHVLSHKTSHNRQKQSNKSSKTTTTKLRNHNTYCLRPQWTPTKNQQKELKKCMKTWELDNTLFTNH